MSGMTVRTTGGLSWAAYAEQLLDRAEKASRPVAEQIRKDAQANAHRAATGGKHLGGEVQEPVSFREPGKLTWEIWCTAPYAKWVEEGRGPGKRPPTDSIKAWVLEVINPGSDAEAQGIAFAIAKNIGAEGHPPTFFMSQAAYDNHGALTEALRAEFGND